MLRPQLHVIWPTDTVLMWIGNGVAVSFTEVRGRVVLGTGG